MVCERDYGGRSEVTDLKDTILGRIALLQMFALLVYCCALRLALHLSHRTFEAFMVFSEFRN